MTLFVLCNNIEHQSNLFFCTKTLLLQTPELILFLDN